MILKIKKYYFNIFINKSINILKNNHIKLISNNTLMGLVNPLKALKLKLYQFSATL
jgi:hypothetical protein